ncbi:MAG: ABC transporter permease, partial [Actinobacteria bacterium]|nr:ABC transporter permease [Actinomycetota bacterium]MBO0788651.1 ABC transporter permease [Actinomycetota bacterium]
MSRIPAPRRVPVLAVILVPVFLAALALAAFSWTSARLAPRGLPLGVAGPRAAAAAEQQLARHPGAFSIHYYPDQARAVAGIRHRSVYGAIVSTGSGATVFTASAASPLVARLLANAATAAGPAAGPAARVRVADLVPADRNDPQGIVFGAALLPLVLVGAIGGVVTRTAAGPAPLRAAFAAAAAAVVGLIAAGLIQGWLGIIPGNWIVNGGVIALTVLAIAAGVGGLASLAGYPGLAVGALLMVFCGNPFSAVGSAPEMLPVPAGAIGQLLPPGAGQELLRSAAYFGGNGSAGHLAVLIVWAVAGITAVLAGDMLRPRRAAPGAVAAAVGDTAPDGTAVGG